MTVKHFILALTAIVTAVLLTEGSLAIQYNQTNFTSNATYTVPSGVSTILVEVIGAGGGGGGANGNDGNGGGGAGGSYARNILSVNPGDIFTVTVGEGGTGGTGFPTVGAPGQQSVFNNSEYTVCASGGGGGGVGPPGGDGPGGAANTSCNTGSTTYSGGAGANGAYLGPGGGAGGSAGAGSGGSEDGLGTGGAGGGNAGFPTGLLSGGSGANKPAAAPNNGNNGNIIGGGGSGGWSTTGNNRNGGNGARGQVSVTEIYAGFVNVNIYNESTGSLINSVNVTIAVTSSNYTTTATTTTGTTTIQNLTAGNYTFVFSANGLSQRTYIVTSTGNSIQTLNAYLTGSTSSTIFTLYDSSTGEPIESAVITQEALISSSWTTVDSKYSDVAGSAQLYYITSQPYRFTISKAGYSTKQLTLNPIIFTSYDIRLNPSTTFTDPQDYEGVTVVFTPTKYYNNQQNNFTFIISSPNGTLTYYNYTIVYPSSTATNSGSNTYGSTLTNQFNITGATTSSTVNIYLCYTTSVSNDNCFTYTYPVLGVYGNNTLTETDTNGLGDLESTVFYTLTCSALGAAAGFSTGPLGFGATWELCTVLFTKLEWINIWVGLIGGFVGFLILLYGMSRP